ncbi:MAG: insulinase family protein [Syntrophus sp. (in: bacteria)]|nr:insulinase family protein [Syntrophus sp. (in: bacteria)]
MICFFSAAPYAEGGLRERVFETTLPNGLKVLLLEDHKAPVVTFQVWYRVGSRNEAWGKTGLSHMLEHMMFKGTKRVSGETFTRLIQENGGNDNAFTSEDFTAYFTNLSANKVHVPIKLEAERMQNLLLREGDFRKEQMVIMEERRLRTEDNPQAFLSEQVQAAAFQTQPYHWPIIGWMDDIKGLTLEDLKAYYRTYYNPANAFIVVAGDFNRNILLSQIRNAFAAIPKGPVLKQLKPVEQPQVGERRILVKKEAQLHAIIMGYHIPNLGSPDGYVLEVISGILSGGKSSRLYERLVREKGLALTVNAENSLLSKDPGLFLFTGELLPGKEIAQLEKAIDEEIERLKTEPITDEELGKAKNQLEAAFVFAQDSLFTQAMFIAQNEILFGWRKIDDYIPSIRAVTAGDISKVAKNYLVPENRTVGILVPQPPKENKPIRSGPPIKERMMR